MTNDLDAMQARCDAANKEPWYSISTPAWDLLTVDMPNLIAEVKALRDGVDKQREKAKKAVDKMCEIVKAERERYRAALEEAARKQCANLAPLSSETEMAFNACEQFELPACASCIARRALGGSDD